MGFLHDQVTDRGCVLWLRAKSLTYWSGAPVSKFLDNDAAFFSFPCAGTQAAERPAIFGDGFYDAPSNRHY